MQYRALVPIWLLLSAVIACGPLQSPPNSQPTQSVGATAAARSAQTLTAAAPTESSRPTATRRPLILGAPTNTSRPADTHAPADTPAPTDTQPPADTDTPVPTRTPRPTNTATPRPTVAPSATPSATRRPVPAGPSFLDSVVAVRKQVENFGGQIDIAVGSGELDCQATVDSYEYVAARATLNNVPANLAGAYGLYEQAVNIFLPKSADLYTNCKHFLANPNGGTIPALQWTVARTSVNDADQLLRQAVIAAGGTP